MTRFEEMDEILERIKGRSQEAAAPAGIVPGRETITGAPAQGDAYAGTVAAIAVALRDAERVREVLSSGHVRTMTREQQDELLTLLGKVLHELWQCEVALQRVAPYE